MIPTYVYPNTRISHRSATTWLSYFKHCHSPGNMLAEGGKVSAPFIYLKYSKAASMDIPCSTLIYVTILKPKTKMSGSLTAWHCQSLSH